MLKLRRYLKPFAGWLAAAIVLLFCQAICDLNLPNLMSEIVNVGIQQSGIENAAPDAISKNGMELMLKFMDGDQKNLVKAGYTLSAPDISVYPKAADEIYVRNETAALDELNSSFSGAAWTLSNTLKDLIGESGTSGTTDLDITLLYGAIHMLDSVPQSVIDERLAQTATTDDMIKNQVGIVFSKGFLSELGTDIAGRQTAYILRIGMYMLLIALLGGAAAIAVSLLSSLISAGVARDLRLAVFEKVESFSSAELDKFSTASLITRSTNDITHIQMLLQMAVRMMFFAPIMGIGGIIMALEKSLSMGWVIAVAVIALLSLILVVFSVAMPKFKIIQKLTDKLNLVSRESLTGMMVIRAFGAREHEEARFDDVNKELTGVNLFINRVMVTMMPIMMLIMNGVTILIVWVGSAHIDSAAMQIGDMMAFIQYAMHVIMSFLIISMMFIFVPRAAVSGDRIAEVLETQVCINDPEVSTGFDSERRGYVEFKNVCFRYHGAENDALHDISFTAAPGQTTAIIGSTGSGKSTLAGLIMRFYDVTAGSVTVSGADVKNVTQKELREQIGYVPQQGMLLSGTIASNLKYGDAQASDETLENAARVAQAMQFIDEKTERFEEPIAQSGTNVSGGQKQRLSIARALVKRPDILIFDDSFSALDFKTDAALRRALKEDTADNTVIVIAQRVNTIMRAEQIIVLEHGRIVGKGTHKELLKSCPQYWEIASTQLTEEELA